MIATDGTLLGGRVLYAQPATGFRSGIEPILLAAAIPARAGQRVLEAGTGPGAALLCLAARVPGVRGVGLDRQHRLTTLAASNARRNGFAALDFITADIETLPTTGPFDHAFTNPPYHDGRGSPSPDPDRDIAKRAATGLVGAWAAALGRCLRHRGTLTLILPARLLEECAAALGAAGCPLTALLPLWPRAGEPAKLILAQGRRNARSGTRVLPGLVLHEPDGRFTATAQAILRDGASLPMS